MKKGKFKNDRSIMIECACGCGELRTKFDKKGRECKFIFGHQNRGDLNPSKKDWVKVILSESQKGHKQSFETIEKRRLKLIGRKQSKEEIEKRMNSLKIIYEFKKGKKYEEIYGEEKAKNIKVKQRISSIEYIKNNCNGIMPMQGKFENKIIDYIEFYTNKKIIRQFYINGYFLDGYCKELNLAIEIDEERHYNKKKQIKRDIEKQSSIINSLHCDFLRIRVKEVVENEKINEESLNLYINKIKNIN